MFEEDSSLKKRGCLGLFDLEAVDEIEDLPKTSGAKSLKLFFWNSFECMGIEGGSICQPLGNAVGYLAYPDSIIKLIYHKKAEEKSYQAFWMCLDSLP
jgi:hypothetical protein